MPNALNTGKVTLPTSVVSTLIKKVQGISTIAALTPSTPQKFANIDYLVFNPSAEAEVVAEGAKKGAYEQTLSPVEAKRVKLVTTTRVSDELIWADEDNQLEIIQRILDDQQAAVGRALDYVVYHAINPKDGAPLTGYTALTAGATAITSKKPLADIDALADAVIDYDINGFALSRAFAADLRKLRVEATGARLFPEIPLNLAAGSIDGIPTAVSNTVDAKIAKTPTKVKAIMGDFSLIKWGMVRDMASEVIQYGDPDNTGVDLKGSNQVAYRTESVLAYAVLDPKGFAVLKEGTSASSAKETAR